MVIDPWDMKMALERLNINRTFEEKEIMCRVKRIIKKLEERRAGPWSLFDLIDVIQGY